MDLFKSFAYVLFVNSILAEPRTAAEACGTTLTSSSGQIISEGYPSMYPNNLSCLWYIIAPSDKVIEIEFLDVDLEIPNSNNECLDTVSVYDGTVDSKLLSRPFCGDGPGWPRFPTRMLSTLHHMTVVMETNGTGTGRGIVAEYRHVSPRIEAIAAVDTDNLQIFHFNRLGYTSPGRISLTGASNPFAISFDPIEENFYFTDIGVQPFIGRVNFGGSRVDVLIDDGLQKPLGIAVGYLTGLIYWTDANQREVSVSRLDGHFRKTLVPANTGCVSPKAILLDPNQENVYWTCLGQIETSKADGRDRKVFASNDVIDPRSLALDAETMTLFWTDSGTLTLESLRLDGSNRRQLIKASVFSDLSGFTIDRFAYFWANPVGKRLHLLDRALSSPTIKNVRQNPPSSIEGIYYYNSAAEIQAPNACRLSNGGCQELCFPDGCKEVTPEIFGCPENIIKLTTVPEAVDWFEPSAKSRSSEQSLPLTIDTRSHEPKDEFPLGTTTVTYSFRDEKGNTKKCLFNVTLINESSTTSTLANETTSRGGQASTYVLISTFTAVLLLIIILIIGLVKRYRSIHNIDKPRSCHSENKQYDEESQEGYSTAVDHNEQYYSIPNIMENNLGIHNGGKRCLRGYITSVDRNMSITGTQVNDARLHNRDKREDRRGSEGNTPRIYPTVSLDIISNTSVNDPSHHDEDVDSGEGYLEGHTTRVDRPLSCDGITNSAFEDHGCTTRVEPDSTYSYVGEQILQPDLISG
ncbi:Low-density lipoprotein receptor-related protein 5 [Holothuria leucospilota]|uniref:Low-density lipoprotein receptor-related protein 5 n=1 Tax=Holothuria leucospilota TaxID=206669 RepID=A0A9Q1CE91_HOLLE|nr:Low-density lipoprotein receptor-related protein 5 [Holothuria leucospilota]